MKAFFPVLTWLVWVILLGPVFRQNQWECLLIMFAAIELVPRGLRLLGRPQPEWYAAIAASLCAAYFFDGFWYLALPYLLWALWHTLREATEVLFLKKNQLQDFIRLFALGFWTTGALFSVLFLADVRPFGFDPVIVSLTSAHFHVAGFVLAVLIYRLVLHHPDSTNRALGWVVMAGMPTVALGITLTQVGFPHFVEQGATIGFLAFAILVTRQQLRLSFLPRYAGSAQWLWMSGSICLWIGLVLAALYAVRFQYPVASISIPNMKLWHGTLNTLGFAWLSIMAWEIKEKP